MKTSKHVSDTKSVIIGFGAIWGLLALGVLLMTSFTMGLNDTAPETIAVTLYGLTSLPACIFAIWFNKGPAIWLILLSVITLYGFIYQSVVQSIRWQTPVKWTDFIFLILVAGIPAFFGITLLRYERQVNPDL